MGVGVTAPWGTKGALGRTEVLWVAEQGLGTQGHPTVPHLPPVQGEPGGTGGLWQPCPCAGAHPSEGSKTLGRFAHPSSAHPHHGGVPTQGQNSPMEGSPLPRASPSSRGRLFPPWGPSSERVTTP